MSAEIGTADTTRLATWGPGVSGQSMPQPAPKRCRYTKAEMEEDADKENGAPTPRVWRPAATCRYLAIVEACSGRRFPVPAAAWLETRHLGPVTA